MARTKRDSGPSGRKPTMYPRGGAQGGVPIVNRATGRVTGGRNRTTPSGPGYTPPKTAAAPTSRPKTAIQNAMDTGFNQNNNLKRILRGK